MPVARCRAAPGTSSVTNVAVRPQETVRHGARQRLAELANHPVAIVEIQASVPLLCGR